MFDFFTNKDTRRSKTIDIPRDHNVDSAFFSKEHKKTLKGSKKYSYEKDLFVSKIL